MKVRPKEGKREAKGKGEAEEGREGRREGGRERMTQQAEAETSSEVWDFEGRKKTCNQ